MYVLSKYQMLYLPNTYFGRHFRNEYESDGPLKRTRLEN